MRKWKRNYINPEKIYSTLTSNSTLAASLSVSRFLHSGKKCRFMKILEILQSWLKIEGYKHDIKHLSQCTLMDPRILTQGAQALLSVYHPQLQIKKVILCTDSCSAIMSSQSFTSHSGHNMVNEIYETLYRLKNMNIWTTRGSRLIYNIPSGSLTVSVSIQLM